MRDGAARGDRASVALEESFFRVDELSFEELLAMGAALSDEVSFYNLRNRKDGTWQRLFANDAASVAAMILGFKEDLYEQRFYRHQENFQTAEAALVVYELALKLDEWLRCLKQTETTICCAAYAQLQEAIDNRLAGQLQWLERFFEYSALRGGSLKLRGEQVVCAEADFFVFGKIWGLKSTSGKPDPSSPENNPKDPSDDIGRQMRLAAVLNSFVAELKRLKTICLSGFESCLTSGDREPSAALFITFARLLCLVKKRSDAFTRRHLEYYYYDYLKFQPRPRLSEQLHALFLPAATAKKTTVEIGQRFESDKDDDGRIAAFEAQSNLTITDAKVNELRAILFERDELISPERELGYVARIRKRHIAFDENTDPCAENRFFPIFCAGRSEVVSDREQEAELGFAVSSEALLLKSGRRKVSISIYFEMPAPQDTPNAEALLNPPSEHTDERNFFRQTFGKFLRQRLLFGNADRIDPDTCEKIAARVEQLFSDTPSTIEVIREILNKPRSVLFQTCFRNIFSVSITGESGFRQIPGYTVVPIEETEQGLESRGMKITFVLPPEAKPLAPLGVSGDEHEAFTKTPAVSLVLNSRTDFFGYSLLAGIEPEKVTVDVDVQGARQLLAYNQNGRLDPETPFFPFGPMPECGNYLILGNSEISRKKVSRLSVSITWGGLPAKPGGFFEHYREYDEPYFDERFEVSTSVFQSGLWHPQKEEAKKTCALFTLDSRNIVEDKTTVEVDGVGNLKPVSPDVPEESLKYSGSTSKGSFFKLTLSGPEQAFGHRGYPEVLSRALMKNAKSKKEVLLPNSPYTPLINDVSISYAASAIVFSKQSRPLDDDVETGGLYQIHPFGAMRTTAEETGVRSGLLPAYRRDANLFIGISAFDLRGPLTLFFHLREDATLRDIPRKGDLTWYYMASDEQKILEARHILKDTTNGLLESGIVKLEIPPDIDTNNTILPGGLYWLCVSTDKNLRDFGNIFCVQPHAVELCRILPEAEKEDTSICALPSGSKLAPVPSIPEAAFAKSIGEPFGGRPLETRDELNIRISERLAHRMRASAPRDIERLVLDAFSEIALVKCFTNSEAKKAHEPGDALVVVVPKLKASSSKSNYMPRAGVGLLARVRDFLSDRASLFANIKVTNPLYEQILVKCAAAGNPELGDGECIERLRRALVDYISPWNQTGNTTKFGWRIRVDHLASYIRQTKLVSYVTALSVLSIAQTGAREFHLGDSAVDDTQKTKGESATSKAVSSGAELKPLVPWSIAVPFDDHLIETIDDRAYRSATQSGIETLEIGKTFIIKEHTAGEQSV